MIPAQALRQPQFLVPAQLDKPVIVGGAAALVAGIVASVAIAIFAIAIAPIAIPFTAALAVGGAVCLAIGLKSLFHHQKIDQAKDEVQQLIQKDQWDEAEQKIAALPRAMQKPAHQQLIAHLLKGMPDQDRLNKAHQIMQLPEFSDVDRQIIVANWADQPDLPIDQKEPIKKIVKVLVNANERAENIILDNLARTALKQKKHELAWFYANSNAMLFALINSCFDAGEIDLLEAIEMTSLPAWMGCDLRCRLAQHYLDKNWINPASKIMERYTNGNPLAQEILYNKKLYRRVQETFLRLSFVAIDSFYGERYLAAAIDQVFAIKKDDFCRSKYMDPDHPYHGLCREGKFAEALDLLLKEWKAGQ